MKKNFSDLLFISAAIVLFLTSCGSMKTMSLNSIELTTQLKPGMTYNEVESLLGKPKSSMVSGDKMIARWNLQQGGGAGTWRITGNKTEGTIVTTSPGGQSTTYKYKSCGDGCIYLGSYKYAYAGAPECR